MNHQKTKSRKKLEKVRIFVAVTHKKNGKMKYQEKIAAIFFTKLDFFCL
jgi:hypothetical protein